MDGVECICLGPWTGTNNVLVGAGKQFGGDTDFGRAPVGTYWFPPRPGRVWAVAAAKMMRMVLFEQGSFPCGRRFTGMHNMPNGPTMARSELQELPHGGLPRFSGHQG